MRLSQVALEIRHEVVRLQILEPLEFVRRNLSAGATQQTAAGRGLLPTPLLLRCQHSADSAENPHAFQPRLRPCLKLALQVLLEGAAELERLLQLRPDLRPQPLCAEPASLPPSGTAAVATFAVRVPIRRTKQLIAPLARVVLQRLVLLKG